MQAITLYRYRRDDGGVTVSPTNPYPKAFETMYRLIADEGKVLKKGDIETTCTDIENDDFYNWQEVDAPIEEQENEETRENLKNN